MPNSVIELVDILTPEGEPTGRVRPKSEAHRDGDWHRAAHLWIVSSDGRVLLQRRAEIKESWPGMWDISVAGHVNAGESPVDAAIREAFEELGIALSAHELAHAGVLRYQAVLNEGAYIENEFHHVYMVRREVELRSLVLDPMEVAEVALVAPRELDRYDLVPHPESYELLMRFVGRGRVSGLRIED